MKILRWTKLIDVGGFSQSTAGKLVQRDVKEAIIAVDWPDGSGKFTIYPEPGKERGTGNGVVPIKRRFVSTLSGLAWELERREAASPESERQLRPGAFDAWRELSRFDTLPFVVEWETGNISSSHRALNKMTFGILREVFSGGVLVIPSRVLARFLTDRIGTYAELEPYFPLWSYHKPKSGYLAIVEVEYDATSTNVPKIPKMTAGRALR